MDYKNKEIRYFMYDSAWDTGCKKDSVVSAECCVQIDDESCVELYSKFSSCIKEDASDDIVELVKSIRSVFTDLEEVNLKVKVKKNDYVQTAEFLEGILYDCSFTNKNWDDFISVSKNYRGVDIKYKKRGPLVQSAIHTEIGVYLSKIGELSNLEYEKKSKMKKKIK